MAAPHTQTAQAPTRAAATNTRAVEQADATTADYVETVEQLEQELIERIVHNPIYQTVIENETLTKEQKIDKIVEYLTAGLESGDAKDADLDARRAAVAEFNTFVQVMRRQLGRAQAEAITDRAYADFQRIINETATDVGSFQGELTPLTSLAELFAKYGVDGNIIDKVNQAREQKQQRETALEAWKTAQSERIQALQHEISRLQQSIADQTAAKDDCSKGALAVFKGRKRMQLERDIRQLTADLAERQQQLEDVQAETPDETLRVAQGDIEPVDEEILKLQDIGGAAFKEAVTRIRDHTEHTLAKISMNFDSAIEGLQSTRASFIDMDRNCTSAVFALQVLEFALRKAEEIARQIAEAKIQAPPIQEQAGQSDALATLDKMEREQRSRQILGYTGDLTVFVGDVGLGITSLLSGQAVIQDILRMNAAALQSANTHKVTGISNTADAVTITIGNIVDVCNRAASRTLADGVTRLRALAEEGNIRMMGGTTESLEQQNRQMEEFVESVALLRETTQAITANSVDLLKEQFKLVTAMREETARLADATTEASRALFNARAGVDEEAPEARRSQPQPGGPRGRFSGLKVS